ncbi:hypothetical protein E3N88_26489 [Mikania micrantha]|uniref:Uncharacterized protein n=1 Tax=Mikania micrantha TaxID=192012 RepID=A0A5N6N9D5_9ASTR|nr:hypothetical protein E3N88_26489 [Mikania micrantha]
MKIESPSSETKRNEAQNDDNQYNKNARLILKMYDTTSLCTRKHLIWVDDKRVASGVVVVTVALGGRGWWWQWVARSVVVAGDGNGWVGGEDEFWTVKGGMK